MKGLVYCSRFEASFADDFSSEAPSWFFAEALGAGYAPSLDGSVLLNSAQPFGHRSPHEGEVLQEAR